MIISPIGLSGTKSAGYKKFKATTLTSLKKSLTALYSQEYKTGKTSALIHDRAYNINEDLPLFVLFSEYEIGLVCKISKFNERKVVGDLAKAKRRAAFNVCKKIRTKFIEAPIAF